MISFVRSIMVAFCALMAIVLYNDFGNVLNLIAGLTFSSLCFVLPPIVYLLKLVIQFFVHVGLFRCSTVFQFSICIIINNIIIILPVAQRAASFHRATSDLCAQCLDHRHWSRHRCLDDLSSHRWHRFTEKKLNKYFIQIYIFFRKLLCFCLSFILLHCCFEVPCNASKASTRSLSSAMRTKIVLQIEIHNYSKDSKTRLYKKVLFA